MALFLFWLQFKMLSAICFNFGRSKILSSGNGLIKKEQIFLAFVEQIATFPFFIENVYNRYIVLLAHWYTKLCHLAE